MESEHINNISSLTREESDTVGEDTTTTTTSSSSLPEQSPVLEDSLPNIAVSEYESCIVTDFSHASYENRITWWKEEE